MTRISDSSETVQSNRPSTNASTTRKRPRSQMEEDHVENAEVESMLTSSSSPLGMVSSRQKYRLNVTVSRVS